MALTRDAGARGCRTVIAQSARPDIATDHGDSASMLSHRVSRMPDAHAVGAAIAESSDSVTVHSLHRFAVGTDSLHSVTYERGCGVASTACLRYRQILSHRIDVWRLSAARLDSDSQHHHRFPAMSALSPIPR